MWKTEAQEKFIAAQGFGKTTFRLLWECQRYFLSHMLRKGWSQESVCPFPLQLLGDKRRKKNKYNGDVLHVFLFYRQPNHNNFAALRSEQAVSKSQNNSVMGPEQNYVVFDISVTSL